MYQYICKSNVEHLNAQSFIQCFEPGGIGALKSSGKDQEQDKLRGYRLDLQR